MKIQNVAFILCFLLINANCSEFGNSSSTKSSNPETKTGGDLPTSNAFPSDSPYLKPNDGTFTLEKMLVNVGTNVVYPATKNMSIQSQLLTQDLNKACATAASSKMDSPEWQKVQAQWKEAMLAFHYMEAMGVGPLRKDDFGTHLYSWPYINLCGIDQLVVKMSNQRFANISTGGTVNIDAAPINVKGLGALEFLLFETGMGTNCNRRAYPEVATWAEKSAAEKTVDRCQLAKEVARDLEKQSKSLERQWDPEQGNFAKTLVDGSQYASTKAALTDLLHGLYSIEELKDLRLARPLGLSKECSSEDGKCPEQAEHVWSGIAIDAMIAQTQGFHDAFFGSADESEKSFSFDDYLEVKRYPEVSSQMGGVLFSLLDNLKAVNISGKFQDQIGGIDPVACKASTTIDRKVELCAIYQDAREITTILKTQILGIFSLEAPPGYQGDND